MDSKDYGSKNYNTAMAHLEAGCIAHGIASIKFRDGEMVMVSLDMLKRLAKQAKDGNQDRVIIFIGNGPELKENLT